MRRVLAIDPADSTGFAIVEGPPARVLWCVQSRPSPANRLSMWWDLIDIARGFLPDVIAIEAPCYQANQGRPHSVSAALGERVGELRGLCWRTGIEVVGVGWDEWQRLDGWAEPMISGARLSERRSHRYAVEVLGVDRRWLVSERGKLLDDAATSCCIGAWVVRS